MSRVAWLLTVLIAILVIALYWLFIWSPVRAEIADTEDQIEAAQDRATNARNRAAQLRAVRDGAPEAAAELAAADVLLPRDAALPSLLRQLQQAADDSGVRLTSVTPARPSPFDTSVGEVSRIQLGLQLEANYFQLIDFTRRLEDPLLSGRGVVWRSASISRSAPPVLSVSLAADVFTQVPVDVAEPVEPDDTDDDDDDNSDDDDDNSDDDLLDELEEAAG